MSNVRSITAAAFVVAAFVAGGSAFAAAPAFTNIADSATTPGLYVLKSTEDSPKVNNSGVAAFMTATSDVGGGTTILYRGSGGPLTTIAVSPTFTGVSSPTIDGAGNVAFIGFEPSGAKGIYSRVGASPAAPIVPVGATFNLVGDPTLSPNGNLAFWARRTTTNVVGIHRATVTGGTITPISEDTGPLHGHFNLPGVNDAGTVGFLAVDDALSTQGLYYGNGGAVSPPLAQTGLDNLNTPDLNNDGVMAVNSTIAIAKVDAVGNVTPVAQASDPAYSSFTSITPGSFLNPGIGDNGGVAFGARLDAGGAGIFLGPDPVADKVIAIGDPLFGSTLSAFFFDRGLSDDGSRLAFAYRLSNGVEGVAVATVPEPSAAVIVSAAALSLLRRRRGR